MRLGSHVAPLGLAFNTGADLPDSYRSGAFVGEHGSRNRPEFNGYKVVFVPFDDGHPSGKAQDAVFCLTAARVALCGASAGGEGVSVPLRPSGATMTV
jgi:glucose/arabinose dehydrogenase